MANVRPMNASNAYLTVKYFTPDTRNDIEPGKDLEMYSNNYRGKAPSPYAIYNIQLNFDEEMISQLTKIHNTFSMMQDNHSLLFAVTIPVHTRTWDEVMVSLFPLLARSKSTTENIALIAGRFFSFGKSL